MDTPANANLNNPTPLQSLLETLNWPNPEQKGIAVWQGFPRHEGLPPTVSVILTPASLHVKVFNIMPSMKLQPHMSVRFKLNGKDGQPTIEEWKDIAHAAPTGTDAEQVKKAAEAARAFITSVGGSPRVDLMGQLFKDTKPTIKHRV